MVAQVQKPAPEFVGPAVVDGLITDISSKDFLGQWHVASLLDFYLIKTADYVYTGLSCCSTQYERLTTHYLYQ